MMRLLIDPHALKRERLKACLSQRELAAAAGMRAATVADAENGIASQPSTIRRLAAALGIRPEQIAKIVN